MNGDFVNFRAVYDVLTDEVMRSRSAFLPDHIRSWFERIDGTPAVAAIVERLQTGLDGDAWLKERLSDRSITRRNLLLPAEPDKSLGLRLLMFRAVAEGRQNAGLLGFVFTPVGRDANTSARAFIDQVFGPMARELRRYLENELSTVPASDRTVTLDHNSSTYTEAMRALDELEQTLRRANDYPDMEDRDQRIVEVSATKRLLKSARVRLAAIVALAGPTLLCLTTKFADSAIGKAATKAIDALMSLFGSIF
jgi:hypothetical protein